MGLRLSLCLVLLLAGCAAPPQTAPETSAPVDAQVEPAARETAETAAMPFVTLTVWNAEQPEIRLVDVEAAREVPGFEPIHALPQALSADGSMLAAVESDGQSCDAFAGGTSCRGNAAVLHLIDLQTRQELTAPISTKGWAWPAAFSPDASQLALAYHEDSAALEGSVDELLLYETASGEIAARQGLPFTPSRLGYTADGQQVVVYGQALGNQPGISEPDPPRVLLLDAATLNIEWDQTLSGVQSGFWCQANCEASHEQREMVSWEPATVFSQDGAKLYIVSADEDLLTTVDFEARSVSNLQIRVQQSWLERILALTAGPALAKGEMSGTIKAAVLSPDGERLYVVEQVFNDSSGEELEAHPSKASPGLKIIDLKTGAVLASGDIQGSRILASPDGANIFVEVGSQGQIQTYVLDAASLKPVAKLEGWEVRRTIRVDGRPVLLASQSRETSTRLSVLDPVTLEPAQTWTVENYAVWPDAH
jgi:hypothetical protein